MAQEPAWRSPPPPELWYPNTTGLTELPLTDVFEVSATKLPIAMTHDLKDVEFLALDVDRAKWYVGRHYAAFNGKRPYLVRAIFENGGTGRFTIYRNGDALIVHHGSLGRPHIKFPLALVVNLDFQPRRIYYFNTGAM